MASTARRLAALRRLADGAAAGALDAGTLAALVRDGLAESAGDRVAATDAGRAWLARAQAGGSFRAQHGDIVRARPGQGAPGQTAAVDVDLAESPLGWLRRRGALDDAAFAAGERLRADFTRGQMMPHVTSNWSVRLPSGVRGSGRAGPADLTDAALAARERVRAALGAVGPDLADVLVGVCCFLEGLGDLERRRRWPARSGKVILGLALSALAQHYGLTSTAAGPAAGRLRQWGARAWKPGVASGE